MPHLIIFIDKDPHAVWEDLQKNDGKVNLQKLISFLIRIKKIISCSLELSQRK